MEITRKVKNNPKRFLGEVITTSSTCSPRQGTEICNFGAPSPLEALHWIFCFYSSICVQFRKTSPLKSGESSEKSSGENRVKSCHVCGCHGFFGCEKFQARKKTQRLTFCVWRPPGGVGVFRAKGWWPKSSCPPSRVCLPSSWVSKRGILDVPGILPGCPGPLQGVFKKFCAKKVRAHFLFPKVRTCKDQA